MNERFSIKNQIDCFEQLLNIRAHVDRLLKLELVNTGLSMREWEFLIYIKQYRYISAGKIASDLGIASTLVSRKIWKLVKIGLIQTQVDLNDRRNKKLSLTVYGEAELKQIEKIVSQNLRDIQGNKELITLAEQIIVLTQKLDRINVSGK